MNAIAITPANADNPDLIALYESAFPKEEQIPYPDLEGLIDKMNLDFRAWYEGKQFVGLTIVYRRADLNWFWYFAVKAELRGRGYGQSILERLTAAHADKPLILDIESPRQPAANREQRQHRYGFYLRNGFRDTGVGKSFEGIDYTILMAGDGTFTQQDYDDILQSLRRFWSRMPEEQET